MLDAIAGVSNIKDEPADLVNVAIEQLVRQRFKLPAFNTLAKAVWHIRAKSYRELYENIYQTLDAKARKTIDDIADLSPYITTHVNRFGKYRLDPNRHSSKLTFDVPMFKNPVLPNYNLRIVDILLIPAKMLKIIGSWGRLNCY